MGTTIRAKLSPKNKYWIEQHRYYELKHFCLQYPTWKKARASLYGLTARPVDGIGQTQNTFSNPTAKCAEAVSWYSDKISLVEQVAKDTDELLSGYILKAVTEGLSYDVLKARLDIPCCRDSYYELYRRFFWLLNKARS